MQLETHSVQIFSVSFAVSIHLTFSTENKNWNADLACECECCVHAQDDQNGSSALMNVWCIHQANALCVCDTFVIGAVMNCPTCAISYLIHGIGKINAP